MFCNYSLAPSQHTEVDRLVLLPSDPDTIHRLLLRKTRASTSLPMGRLSNAAPRTDITPTIADCGYRAPLPPRLARKYYRNNDCYFLLKQQTVLLSDTHSDSLNSVPRLNTLPNRLSLRNSLISITVFYASVNTASPFLRNRLKNKRIN